MEEVELGGLEEENDGLPAVDLNEEEFFFNNIEVIFSSSNQNDIYFRHTEAWILILKYKLVEILL